MRHLANHRNAFVKTALAVLAIGLPLLGQTAKPRTPRITGTYTNMYYNRESGDVLGEEIKIVVAEDGYQGVLQFAEGVPLDLIVVDVKAVGNKIGFSIPDSSVHAGEFNGAIEEGVLKGEFRFKSGGVEQVRLPRGKSYWD